MAHESLKLFRDIAQTRSFSRGAALNSVSQSAASQQIQELEQDLGIELFDRSTRPLVVTAAGHLYSDFCRDVLRRREEFNVALDRMKQEVEGTVRVASIYSVGLSEMVQLEQEFGRRLPEAKLEVEYLRPEKVYWSVLSDSADLGLVSYPEPSREITVIPWRQEEMVVAASPYHPLAQQGGTLAPSDLQAVDFIGFDDDLPIARDIDRFLAGQGIKVNTTLHFDNIQMIKEAVAHRVGVSIMPARIMKDEIAQGRLVAIPIAAPELYRPLGIIHRKKKRFYPVAQAFLELLCEKPTEGASYECL
ncbi:MAG TPA: LysR family transcriptional regulator [Bryobacteraceae bacterium]|jgi:DNA-binding transcriptional LysR family regulator|nr:LysR family transcriptional regulator [Bryobacteraceae bacterium]